VSGDVQRGRWRWLEDGSPFALRLALAACTACTALLVSACMGGDAAESPADSKVAACRAKAGQDEQLACFTALYEVTPLETPPAVSDALFTAGQDLFTSTKLSGTGNASCNSCHANNNAGVESRSAEGLVRPLHISLRGGAPDDPANTASLHRNANDLVNKLLGNPRSMFWDGRVALEDGGGYTTPAGAKLPGGLDSLLAAQALFPLLAREEMLGFAIGSNGGKSENTSASVADPVEADPQPVWDAAMQRVMADPVLSAKLAAAFPALAPASLGIQHVANALAGFQTRRWNAASFVSGFHGWLRDRSRWPISEAALRGGLLFFDKAGCARCHSGPRLTDWKFHNLAVPQIGPGFGTGANETPKSDKGRYEVTRQDADLYAFVTPSLWEVRATAPYFHNGVYDSLEKTVRHHLDATTYAQSFRCGSDAPLVQPGIQVACRDSLGAAAFYADMTKRVAEEMKTPIALSDSEVADLVAFLNQLANGSNNTP